MKTRASFTFLMVGFVTFLAGMVLLTEPVAAQAPSPMTNDFMPMIPQGFGDRQNSYAWSMVWWKDRLYVGTGRSTQCVQDATGALFYPGVIPYPPTDPDIECTDSPQDLALRAEIWRWTPESDSWDRVFISPQDVPIDDFPGKLVARDIGFRSMILFTEPDGTEALYVGGVSSNSFNPGTPPPRILRSTDGLNFEPIPQDAGTFLGDTKATSFRSMVVFKDQLFVIASEGYAGFGVIYVTDNPKEGNDNFRLALPADITAFELSVFDEHLYVGTGSNAFAFPPDPDAPPFQVLKTPALGEPPYTHTVVIDDGAFRPQTKSRSVVSMHVFKNALYVGTDRPAELYRVHADDSWDLIAGVQRWTPIGIKYPLSGFGTGFDNRYNIHIWRMETFGDRLYVGTMDQSTKWRIFDILDERLRDLMGFDLFSTTDGIHYAPVTLNGFGDIFDVGVRNFIVTPYGMIIGTANHYYGTKLWRLSEPPKEYLYLPYLQRMSSTP